MESNTYCMDWTIHLHPTIWCNGYNTQFDFSLFLHIKGIEFSCHLVSVMLIWCCWLLNVFFYVNAFDSIWILTWNLWLDKNWSLFIFFRNLNFAHSILALDIDFLFIFNSNLYLWMSLAIRIFVVLIYWLSTFSHIFCARNFKTGPINKIYSLYAMSSLSTIQCCNVK